MNSHTQPFIHSDNRIINYLRISVTDRCNLACRYCVPKEALRFINHDKIARYEELHKIVVCASEVGITKLRVTGGEPLMRKGVLPFIKGLSKIDGIKDISITTNGVLLESNINEIIESGVNRINISLDTLKPDRFAFISGRDNFKAVWRGIMSALDKGLSPIKLNAVILRGINYDEIEDLAALSLKYPFHVRFIEYMPMGNSAVDIAQQVLIPEIRERIEQNMGKLDSVGDINLEAGPAKRYKIKGALGEIGFISPVSSHFCHQCNRLRVTSTGHLRPCLLNNQEFDILTPLRQGASCETIKQIFLSAIKRKPSTHNLNYSDNLTISDINKTFSLSSQISNNRVQTQMSTIGG